MDYGPEDSGRYSRRMKKQRRYQRAYRDVQADEGVPDRDDVAKVVLSAVLSGVVNRPDSMGHFVESTAERLSRENKRFDKDMSAEVLRNMIERHRQQMDRDARRRAAGRRRET